MNFFEEIRQNLVRLTGGKITPTDTEAEIQDKLEQATSLAPEVEAIASVDAVGSVDYSADITSLGVKVEEAMTSIGSLSEQLATLQATVESLSAIDHNTNIQSTVQSAITQVNSSITTLKQEFAEELATIKSANTSSPKGNGGIAIVHSQKQSEAKVIKGSWFQN